MVWAAARGALSHGAATAPAIQAPVKPKNSLRLFLVFFISTAKFTTTAVRGRILITAQRLTRSNQEESMKRLIISVALLAASSLSIVAAGYQQPSQELAAAELAAM